MNPPKIMKPNAIENINEHLIKKTGCFAFLISDKQWVYSEPQSGKEAFELWTVALYTIYHDYGCGYIRYILDESNAPIQSMRDDLKRCRRHFDDITKIFRNNIAHGIFDFYSRKKLKQVIFKYLKKSNCSDELCVQLTDQEWFDVASSLKNDANFLVDTLYEWGDNFDKSFIPVSVLNPRCKFGESSNFTESISERIVFDSLDKDYWEPGVQCARKLLDNLAEKDLDKKDSKSTLKDWQKIVQKEFLEGKIQYPNDIVNKLKNLLYEVHNPSSVSSISIAARHGFSIDGL